MRINRFFVNKPLGEETFTDNVRLVHQIKTVLRLTVSDTVVLFNGINSFDYHFCITEITKEKISFRLLKEENKVSSHTRVFLFLSEIRKELFELACLKACELGVTDIIPLQTFHTQKTFINKERLKTILIEGAEQSGRNTLPTLSEKKDLRSAVSFCQNISNISMYALTLFGDDIKKHLSTEDPHTHFAFFIGPEGGWSEEEEFFLKSEQLKRISVSPQTLRTETAAIICTYLPSILKK